MKYKLLVAGLFLATAMSTSAATRAGVLLRGDALRRVGDRVTVSGAASAVVKGVHEDFRVQADQIIFQADSNQLECVGSVTITLSGRRITAKQLTIDLGDETARVFTLSSDGQIQGKEPNKAPEPTTTSVTVPAAQESRQP